MTALDQKTCEAIANYLDEEARTAKDSKPLADRLTFAANRVRDMLDRPPEPPATPTAGALRAARKLFVTYIPEHIRDRALIIDREAGLPALVAACRYAVRVIEQFWPPEEDVPEEHVGEARAVAEACAAIKAALAKHDGVSE